MPAVDARFVSRLDDFTKALEGIVDLLKQDVGKKNVDNVNKMLTNMNDQLGSVVKNMEIVVKAVGRIETKQDQILEEVKAARKAKEAGVFNEIAEVDNKKKIIDAIKVVTLIAAGVLAMGLALKIIAPVNFFSVIAIGLAIVFISGAFIMVAAATEGLEIADIAKVSGMMVVMALGLTVSSWALALASTLSFTKAMTITFVAGAMGISLVLMAKAIQKAKIEPKDYIKFALLPLILPVIALGLAISSLILSRSASLTFGQMVSLVFVAGAMGVSLYLISKALESSKFQVGDVGKFLLLPLIIPALAIGLVVASIILKGTASLSFAQMISAIFVAVTVGVLVYLMKPLIEKLKGFNLGQIAQTTLMVAAIAAGLVIASWILTKMSFFTIKQAVELVFTSIAIGLAVLALTPAFYILKNIEHKDMLKAGLNILIAAGTIAAASWIISLGNYDEYPGLGWTIGVGLSILAFAGTIWLLNKMDLSAKEMLIGGLAIIGISAVILITSLILGEGNYDEYPSLGWSIGVGLSLVAFGTGMMVLGLILTSTGGIALEFLAAGALATIGVAATIVATSLILGLGNYDNYPDFEWSVGVGLTLIAFGSAMMVLGGLIMATGGAAAGAMLIGAIATLAVAGTIVAVSLILGLGQFDNYPTFDWAAGVGLSMVTFGTSMLILGLLGPFGFLAMAMGALAILTVASTITAVSVILALGNYKDGPTGEWALATGSILFAVATTGIIFAAMIPFILIGGWAMRKVAQTIVDVAAILGEGDYTGGPTEEWARGVGSAIEAFAKGIAALAESDSLLGMLFGEDEGAKIVSIANAMKTANDILSSVNWSGNYPSEAWAKGVGGGIMAFADGIKKLAEADIDNGFDFIWMVSMISYGLITAAKILNEFDWANIKNYPSAEWSRAVGEAINAFAIPLAELAKVDITGGDITRGIRKLSRGLIDAAEIIGEYDWSKAKNYPSSDWVDGVGRAIGTFVRYLVEIEKNDIGSGDLRVLRKVINAMIQTAEKISDEDPNIWEIYPSEEWSNNVGKAIGTFVKYLEEIEKSEIGRGEIRVLNKVIKQMINAAEDFADVDENVWYKGPPKEWAESVEKSIGAFVNSINALSKLDEGSFDLMIKAGHTMIHFAHRMAMLEKYKELFVKGGVFDNFSDSMKKLTDSLPTPEKVEGLKTLSEALSNITSMGLTTSFSIWMLSKSMADLGETLKNIDLSSMDKLSKFSNGILVLSLIDERKLDDAIKILDKKRDDIKSILSDNATVKTRPATTGTENVVSTSSAVAEETSSKSEFYDRLLSYVKNLDSNVDKMANKQTTDEEETEDDLVAEKPNSKKVSNSPTPR
jgi:hypothetical protein